MSKPFWRPPVGGRRRFDHALPARPGVLLRRLRLVGLPGGAWPSEAELGPHRRLRGMERRRVSEDSGAEQAGIRPGDEIVSHRRPAHRRVRRVPRVRARSARGETSRSSSSATARSRHRRSTAPARGRDRRARGLLRRRAPAVDSTVGAGGGRRQHRRRLRRDSGPPVRGRPGTHPLAERPGRPRRRAPSPPSADPMGTPAVRRPGALRRQRQRASRRAIVRISSIGAG